LSFRLRPLGFGGQVARNDRALSYRLTLKNSLSSVAASLSPTAE